MKKISVGVVMGSDSDLPVMKETLAILRELEIGYDVKVLSAHRSPRLLHQWVSRCEKRGVGVFIAAAGGAAHLAGVIASQTLRPVIGVPMPTQGLRGVDSFVSTLQMPAGVPVATVAIGVAGARNAGLLAAQILSTGAGSDGTIQKKLREKRRLWIKQIRDKNKALPKRLIQEF